MESEGYLISRKFYFCIQEVLQQQRLFWHRVHANYKQITKADSAEGNARVSTKLIQVRVTILTIFFYNMKFSHRWSTGGPPVATAKAADATCVVHRWDFGGSSVTIGGL